MGIAFNTGDGFGDTGRRAQRAARKARWRAGTQTLEDRRRRLARGLFVEAFAVGWMAVAVFFGGLYWFGWILAAVAFALLLFGALVRLAIRVEREQSTADAAPSDKTNEDETGAEVGVEEVSEEEVRRLRRLCLKHRLALLLADANDVNSLGVEDIQRTERQDVLWRATRCARCRAKNPELQAAASSSVAWNPTSVWSPATEPRPHRGRGRLAVLGGLAILMAVLFAAPRELARLMPDGLVSGPILSLHTDELEAGDCVRDMTNTEAGDLVTVVPCSKKHLDEVFAVFDLPQYDWPGEDYVESHAVRGCRNRFERYVGTSPAAPQLRIAEVYPDSETWDATFGTVTCMLETGDYSTGTLHGSAR